LETVIYPVHKTHGQRTKSNDYNFDLGCDSDQIRHAEKRN